MDTIGIFAYTFFDKPIHNYDFVNKGYYLPERKDTGLAPDPNSFLNYYSDKNFVKNLRKIYKFLRKIFK